MSIATAVFTFVFPASSTATGGCNTGSGSGSGFGSTVGGFGLSSLSRSIAIAAIGTKANNHNGLNAQSAATSSPPSA